jgi:hypothetical protein
MLCAILCLAMAAVGLLAGRALHITESPRRS